MRLSWTFASIANILSDSIAKQFYQVLFLRNESAGDFPSKHRCHSL